MVRWGRAEAPGPRNDVSFRLHQKTAKINASGLNRAMQWSVLTELKQKNELAQNEFRFIRTIIITRIVNYRKSFASISALHCSKRRQISRWWWSADQCSGVRCSLKKMKKSTCCMKLMKLKEKSVNGQGGGLLLFVLRVDATSIG